MARKTYSEQFRRQAVELYESTPGATFRGIAADMGITRNTLNDWVATRGRASTTGTSANTSASTSGTSFAGSGARAGSSQQALPRPDSPQAELALLRARVQVLESENTLLGPVNSRPRGSPRSRWSRAGGVHERLTCTLPRFRAVNADWCDSDHSSDGDQRGPSPGDRLGRCRVLAVRRERRSNHGEYSALGARVVREAA